MCITVMDKMNKTWEYCVKLYGLDRCVALCHHGSYNYELDLPSSDVDAKLFITPTWDEVVFCRQPSSKTIAGPFGDINITDIRLFISTNLVKQNFNFLECLFTPYSCVNPAYADLWNELIEQREEIAHYKPEEAIRTMLGQAENQYKRWNKFDNKKTLYHMMRISWAIESYLKGNSFKDTLVPNNRDLIMRVRNGEICEVDMEFMFYLFHEHIHYCVDNIEYKGKSNELIVLFLEEIQKEFVYRALYDFGVDN